jgi:NAD(P)-dependent dehydrogenase (short-subunit alcohol dehydrogenase family)
MNLKLKDKSVLITGSTSGIGYSIAKIFLKERSVVYINGRSEDKVAKAIASLKEEVPNAVVKGFVLNFLNAQEIQIQLKKLPKIDILINNVGVYTSKSFFDTSAQDWQTQFQVNVMSGVELSKHVMPGMLKQNWGRILFISSECTYLVPPDMISYSATKAALHATARGLSHLTKSTAVTVNTVVPGSTLTEGAQVFLNDKAKAENKAIEEVEQSFFKEERFNSLLQRFAKVEEVASTVAYLCSPLSSATNGSVVKVDGGSSGGIL